MRMTVTVSAVAVLGAVAYAGWANGGFGNLFRPRHTLSQPSAIGSLPLLQTSASQSATAAMRASFAKNAEQTVSGVYGTNAAGAPEVFFAAARGGAAETSAQVIADLTAAGLHFDSAGAVTRNVAGQDFACGVLAPSALGAAALCAWNDSDIDGVVINVGSADLQATLNLAAAARAASEH